MDKKTEPEGSAALLSAGQAGKTSGESSITREREHQILMNQN